MATTRARTARELLIASRSRIQVASMSDAVVTPLEGIDPAAGVSVVALDASLSSGDPLDEDAWEIALSVGRRALAHQIAGATTTMLDLARAHAIARVQFGRPVAGFQAVRHRLAESLVAVEALDAALSAAADTPSPATALLAKAVAGRTARTVAAHCQQVLAGIGFTTDHAFHRYLKRTILLDGLLGSSDDLVLDVGRELMRTRNVPTLIEL
jgi:alkylation response protein AidB-like acyl-CoA dehydrogenase